MFARYIVKGRKVIRLNISLIGKAKELSTEAQSTKSYFISGFSPFASRKDVEIVLGAHRISNVDLYLDSNHFPTGMYSVSLSDSDMRELQGQFRHPTDSSTQRYVLQPPQYQPPSYWSPSSQLNVTNKTVRCQVPDTRMGVDELMFLFDDYRLRYDSFRKYDIYRKTHFLIDFSCPEEAERVVAEKNHANVFGKILHLFWFQG